MTLDEEQRPLIFAMVRSTRLYVVLRISLRISHGMVSYQLHCRGFILTALKYWANKMSTIWIARNVFSLVLKGWAPLSQSTISFEMDRRCPES